MTTYTVEIIYKKPEFDSAANAVKAELVEAGQTPAMSAVVTRRLYRIEGNVSKTQIESAAKTLLVDPVVETWKIEESMSTPSKNGKAPKAKSGLVVDVWPKPGVTDPVGETVEKGWRDLGFPGPIHASSATRYVFPKLNDKNLVTNLTKRSLANELIHDIHVRTI
jgi:phosphoribosylformylglycinamidine (FGAM) synthase PurS component